MVRVERKSLFRLLLFLSVSAVVLTGLISMDAHAQDENETCPCFSYEEVEAIFLRGAQLTMDEGEINCLAEDYSVECTAEVAVFDQNYATTAQASVKWADFDPSRCEYLDSTADPVVDRSVRWPHPAPEAAARACFNIISSVIAKSDSSGKCRTYP